MDACYKILIQERLAIFLILLKITPNLMGYDFFKQGAEKIVYDSDKKINVGLGLYKELAEDNGVKQDLVDRAMRHAIDVSYKRNGLYDFEKTYNIKFYMTKPSPKELLCILAEVAVTEANKILRNKERYA